MPDNAAAAESPAYISGRLAKLLSAEANDCVGVRRWPGEVELIAEYGLSIHSRALPGAWPALQRAVRPGRMFHHALPAEFMAEHGFRCPDNRLKFIRP